MSDDTTTWLKKNTALNPLRRSLKTSLRFHVPNPDMDTSIMSNPDRSKNQDIFIPPMLQRSKMQMRTSRAYQFKIPELVVTKPSKKKEVVLSSKIMSKKSPAVPKKSFLPVPKTKLSTAEKETGQSKLPRPSLMPGSSGRNTTARREIIQKMVELSEVKKTREEVTSQLKITSVDNSVLRSILKKKRASLRRTSQISGKKPKAKKVLFDGFQASDAEENDENESPMKHQMHKKCNDFTALDEPTLFFSFPNTQNMTSSPQSLPLKEPENSSWTLTDNSLNKNSFTGDSAASILKMWTAYKGNADNLQTMQNSMRDSLDSLLEHAISFQSKYESFKKDSEEIYASLTKLGNELEENLKKALEKSVEKKDSLKPKRISGKKLLEKVDKIRLSNKSKAIKRSSGNKIEIKKELIKEMEDSFSLVYKRSSFLNPAKNFEHFEDSNI